MPGREFYGRYHRRLLTMAREAGTTPDWRPGLESLLADFDRDAAALDPTAARLLREELCGQLEPEALRLSGAGRALLSMAVKRLEAPGERPA